MKYSSSGLAILARFAITAECVRHALPLQRVGDCAVINKHAQSANELAKSLAFLYGLHKIWV